MRFNPKWCRRSFLKASLLTFLTLSGGEFAWSRELLEEGLPIGKISLYNTHTRERLNVAFRDRSGEYDPKALKAIDWALRCHYTDEAREIDLRTIEFLSLVDRKLGGNHEIHVISGYRSPTYNEKLHRKGSGVARRSLHLEGKAIDIRIPGIKLSTLHHTAMNLEYGGVGYYPGSDFVHLDSGRIRTW